MQDFIRFLESHNELKIIDTPLDIELEIPHLAYLEVNEIFFLDSMLDTSPKGSVRQGLESRF